MTATRTLLRGIASIDIFNRNACSLSLVSDLAAQVCECPAMQVVASRLTNRYPRANARVYSVDGVAPTHTAHDSNRARNENVSGAVRRLTPTECERLQGFPDGWTSSQSDAQRYKQLGNAVCVNVAEWLGKRIVAAHNHNADSGKKARG